MELSMNEVFVRIRYGELTDIEMYNYLEKITDNFKLFKLKLIETDFSVFFYPLKHEFEDTFTKENIKEAIKYLKENNKPVPYINTPILIDNEPKYLLDIEQLLFPMEFYSCRQFEGLINKLIEKHSKNKIDKGNLNLNNASLKKDKPNPLHLEDIFSESGWEKYIAAFEKTTPPLLINKFNNKWEFKGSVRKHKGVICSWIKHLQIKHIVKQNIDRQALSKVLNSNILNFDLGKDGKTFDTISKEFQDNFLSQLERITKE
jgi:hypothetical protein